MNEALGGLFSSRINLNLREQHGYTYGASSQFVFRRTAGPFLVASGVRTDVTAPAVDGDLQGSAAHAGDAAHADELALAKDSLVRSLPAQFETSASVTASTANIYIYDLGLDYYTKLPARLSAVTADAGQGGGREVRRSREAAGRGGRRSREDRTGAAEAQSRRRRNARRGRHAGYRRRAADSVNAHGRTEQDGSARRHGVTEPHGVFVLRVRPRPA